MSDKPKFIDKEELKKRIDAGIQARIKNGQMAKADAPVAQRDYRGAHFTKAQRKEFTARVELAVYDLAHGHYPDWYDNIREIARIMKQANFTLPVVQHTLKNIEHLAVELTGDKRIYARAQAAIHHLHNRLISIPGTKPVPPTKEAENDAPISNDNTEPAPRAGDKRPAGDGETRH